MEPWFDVTYSWIPGTLLGVIGGIVGALAGILAPRGIGGTFILGTWISMVFTSILLFGAAIVAKIQGQPYGIWYGLGLAGLIGILVYLPNYFSIRNRYIQSEMRKIDADSVGFGALKRSAGMKFYPLTAMDEGSSKALHCLLLGAELSALPKGYIFESFILDHLETTKRGIELRGEIWFMDGVPSYRAHICLCRPAFTSVASATEAKVLKAEVLESVLLDGTLGLRIGTKTEQVVDDITQTLA